MKNFPSAYISFCAYFLLTVIGSFNLLGTYAYAQNQVQNETAETLLDILKEDNSESTFNSNDPLPAFNNDYTDIPDEWIKEAQAFGKECAQSRIMPMYFDCRCMEVQYLDRRITLGPETDKSVLVQGIGPKCSDGTGISGHLYNNCKQYSLLLPADIDLEKFCSCYGNTYAKEYEQLNISLNSQQHIGLMSMARLTCRNPRAARFIYGRRFGQ